jgi:hypothetical protein
MSFAVALAALTAGCADGGGESASEVLDARTAPYIEDEPGGRALALIGARLERDGGLARLHLQVAADGACVEPVPGFQGVRGSNRITARELDRLARAGTLEVWTASDATPETPSEGLARIARRGRVPERRVGAAGELELGALGSEELALELAIDAGRFGPGRYATRVVVAGRPRLEVRFHFDGREGAIDAIDPHPVPVPEELGP